METGALGALEIAGNLKVLLLEVAEHAKSDFSGLGIIVWDGVISLPVYPMRDHAPDCTRFSTTREALSAISRESSAFHDGFHVVGEALQLQQAAVYFSPNLVHDLVIPAHARTYGGRYLAAAFGSCLQGVRCTGVLSSRYGPHVLVNGREL